MGTKGTAAIGICGAKENSLGCWQAREVGDVLIQRCKYDAFIGGIARIYEDGSSRQYLDLLIYHI